MEQTTETLLAAPAPPTGSSAPQTGRLMSLDALRGFDMFWIVGADALVEGLRKVDGGSLWQVLAQQLEHVEWAGFHFEDLIFPLFVFMMGVSLNFSLDRTLERAGKTAALRHILRRAALMYLLGIFYYGGFSTAFHDIRLLGVLQRIALAYLFGGLAYCFTGWRGRIAICAGLLIGYWALLTFVPVPGIGAGHFEAGRNLTNWIDKNYLPLRRWDGRLRPGRNFEYPARHCQLPAGSVCRRNIEEPPRRRSEEGALSVGRRRGLRAVGLALELAVSGD